MVCPVIESSRIISKKWSIPVMEEIALGNFDGFNRFLDKTEGITPRILSMCLQELVNAGLIKKRTYDKRNKTGYNLTQKGLEMHTIIAGIKKWNIRWGNVSASCLNTACTECRKYAE